MRINKFLVAASASVMTCLSAPSIAAPSAVTPNVLNAALEKKWMACMDLSGNYFKDKEVNIVGIFVGRDLINPVFTANDRIFVKLQDPSDGTSYWASIFSSASSELGRAQLDMLRFIYQQQVPMMFTCDRLTGDTIDSVAMDPGVESD